MIVAYLARYSYRLVASVAEIMCCGFTDTHRWRNRHFYFWRGLPPTFKFRILPK